MSRQCGQSYPLICGGVRSLGAGGRGRRLASRSRCLNSSSSAVKAGRSVPCFAPSSERSSTRNLPISARSWVRVGRAPFFVQRQSFCQTSRQKRRRSSTWYSAFASTPSVCATCPCCSLVRVLWSQPMTQQTASKKVCWAVGARGGAVAAGEGALTFWRWAGKAWPAGEEVVVVAVVCIGGSNDGSTRV